MTKKAIYKPTNQQTVVLQGFEEYCEILLDGEYKSVLKTELLFESIHDDNFNKIFDAIESKEIKPKQGIFYDGQIFDAYAFVSDLIKSAKNSITLFDNYIDESVLTLLSKNQSVAITIYTRTISKQLDLDTKKYNTKHRKREFCGDREDEINDL